MGQADIELGYIGALVGRVGGETALDAVTRVLKEQKRLTSRLAEERAVNELGMDDGAIGKHGPYGTHTNLDGSPVTKGAVCGLTDWRGVKCTEPATAYLCVPHMKALAACWDLPPGQVAKTPPSALQEEVERLNRVLLMHVMDEHLMSWVGTSKARIAAVMAVMVGQGVSLRRAIAVVAARRPEIPASNYSEAPAQVDEGDEADEPEGVGAGAPWDDDDSCGPSPLPYYKAIHEPTCTYRRLGAPHPCTCEGHESSDSAK